jgi:hypothetical protein
MIVVREADRLRLVTQPDHAAFAADLLALWRLEELVEHPRRVALLRAIRRHDNGWRELDAAPPADPASGLPYTFLDLPRAQRLELWDRGSARYAETDPYTGLLTTHHALALLGPEPLPQLVDRRLELLTRCGLDEADLAADYRFLDLADRLSLAVCNAWAEPFARHGWRAAFGPEGLALSPFPLAGATTFEVPCRFIPARPYGGDADLAVTLATARWEAFAVRAVTGT